MFAGNILFRQVVLPRNTPSIIHNLLILFLNKILILVIFIGKGKRDFFGRRISLISNWFGWFSRIFAIIKLIDILWPLASWDRRLLWWSRSTLFVVSRLLVLVFYWYSDTAKNFLSALDNLANHEIVSKVFELGRPLKRLLKRLGLKLSKNLVINHLICYNNFLLIWSSRNGL